MSISAVTASSPSNSKVLPSTASEATQKDPKYSGSKASTFISKATVSNLHYSSSSSFSTQTASESEVVAAAAAAVAESLKKNTFKNSKLKSFEEWRKENLEKSGQKDYYDDKAGSNSASSNSRKPKSSKSKSKSSKSSSGGSGRGANSDMGMIDELEIDVNIFGGEEEDGAESISIDKQYKDRFNYASFDCAATILKTNKEAKGASNILGENKDSYMLNKCSAPKKFVIVELCQDILVDTVAIGTYEFFSSMFRHIRISVADRYPVPEHDWKVLGEFEGKSVRDMQYFHIKNPLIWARYIRIEFLTHWGHEYYCPVTVLRVYGTTMMEEYKKAGQSGSSGKKISAVGSNTVANTISEKLLRETLKSALSSSVEASVDVLEPHSMQVEEVSTEESIDLNSTLDLELPTDVDQSDDNFENDTNEHVQDPSTSSPETHMTAGSEEKDKSKVTVDNNIKTELVIPVETVYESTEQLQVIDKKDLKELDCLYMEAVGNGVNGCLCNPRSKQQNEALMSLMNEYSLCDVGDEPLLGKHQNFTSAQSQTQNHKEEGGGYEENDDDDDDDYEEDDEDDEDEEEYETPAATQESVFQTIMKRISLLESNATLSMKYIESQTQSLLEQVVILNAEHDARVKHYISTVNESLARQRHALDEFRGDVVSVVVSALNEQREDQRAAEQATSEQMMLLASDLRQQKQIAILQGLALLVVLMFVIVTRGASIDGPAATGVLSGGSTRRGARGGIGLRNSGGSFGKNIPSGRASPLHRQTVRVRRGLRHEPAGKHIELGESMDKHGQGMLDVGVVPLQDQSQGFEVAHDKGYPQYGDSEEADSSSMGSLSELESSGDNMLLVGHGMEDEDDDNDYSYTNNDIETWRKKMSAQTSGGRWVVSPSSPSSPQELDSEEEDLGPEATGLPQGTTSEGPLLSSAGTGSTSRNSNEEGSDGGGRVEQGDGLESGAEGLTEMIQNPLEPVALSVSAPLAAEESTPGGLETIQEHRESGQEHGG